MEEAKKILFKLINSVPRPDNLTEDLNYITDAKDLWNKYFI